MTALTGLGIMIIDFFRTIVIDSILKIILHSETCIIPQIKLGGPMLEN